jgi:hypothetical protein
VFEKPGFSGKKAEPRFFQIRVSGYLDPSWSGWFSGWAIFHERDEVTLLYGSVQDQSALFGVLNKLQDLGLSLLSLIATPLEDPNSDNPGDG